MGGALGFDGVGVGRGLHGLCRGGLPALEASPVMMVRQGTEWAVKRTGTRRVCRRRMHGAGFGPDGPEFFGEGLGEEWVVGPPGDEVDLHAFGGGHDGAAVEADAGAGVLRGEADGFEFADAVGAHLGDDVGDVGMPVAHADVDGEPQRASSSRAAWREGPAGEGWGFGAAVFG